MSQADLPNYVWTALRLHGSRILLGQEQSPASGFQRLKYTPLSITVFPVNLVSAGLVVALPPYVRAEVVSQAQSALCVPVVVAAGHQWSWIIQP